MAFLKKGVTHGLSTGGFMKHPYVRDQLGLCRMQYYTCLLGSTYSYEHRNSNRLAKSPVPPAFTRGAGWLGPFKGAFPSVLDWIGEIKRKELLVGLRWYQTIDQVNVNEFFDLLNLEDSYYSWFKVVELHTWMILVRLKNDQERNQYTRRGVVEAFLLDFETRAKMTDRYNKKYKEDIKFLFKKFQNTIFAYDEGLLSNDMVLAEALWIRFFDRTCDDPRKLEALISFIRFQIDTLFPINSKFTEKGELPNIWTPFSTHYMRIFEKRGSFKISKV